MKRLLACVMAVLLVFSMSGCAQDTSKQDAETVVTKYYDQLKKGEFDEATKLCTSDVSDDNEYVIITDSMDQMIEEMQLPLISTIHKIKKSKTLPISLRKIQSNNMYVAMKSKKTIRVSMMTKIK